MKSYLRFLSRNKLYTASEIVGLSLALAFVIPMICFYTNIARISKGHDNYENIYSLCVERVQVSSPGFGDFLKERVPEIEKVTSPILNNAWHDIENTNRKIHYVDKDFFYFFPAKFSVGGIDFLDTPDGIAVSKEFADYLAKDGPVIGREIDFNWNRYIVNAVFDEYGNGVLSGCDILMNNEPIRKSGQNKNLYEYRGSMTFFSVNPSADMDEVKAKIYDVIIDFWGEDFRDDAFYDTYDLIRYDKITTDESAYIGIESNHTSVLIILGILCVVLFSIPLLNYINLNVALTTKRAKEMAMRKLNGASQRNIVFKYCLESMAFTAVCFVFGLLLSDITSDVWNSFMNNTGAGTGNLALSWTPANILIFIALIVITGLICGIVPALIVSHFTPLDVTKGDFRYHSKKTMSRIFIGFQSLLSVVLIAITLYMEAGFSQLRNVDYNCDVDDVFWYAPRNGKFNTEGMLDILKGRPEILNIGLTDNIPGSASLGAVQYSDMGFALYSYIRCDADAFDSFGFDILSQASDDNKYGIWMTPQAQQKCDEIPGLLEKILQTENISTTNIAGMIQDYPSQSDRPGEAITFVLVTPRENIWLKQLAIKTIPDHATARKIIADAYSEISGEEITDIMHFGYASSYVMEVHKGNISEEKAMVVLIRTMMILVILMTMLGLTGMSVYFASEKMQDIAIRKIFGGTIGTETVRNIKAYMKIVLIADIIALPLIYLLLSQLSSNSVVKVGNTFWIYASAIAMSFVIAILAVLWQTLRAARTNPAEALKKE